MPEMTSAYEWHGRTVVDPAGEKLGTIDEIYFDGDEQPEWARLSSGFLGRSASLVPLAGAAPQGGAVAVSVTQEQVKDSPTIESDGKPSEDEERRVFAHYGIDYDAGEAESDPDGPDGGSP